MRLRNLYILAGILVSAAPPSHALVFSRTDYSTGGTFSTAVSIADKDGDGLPDVFTANYTSGDITVFRNVGGGTLVIEAILPAAGPFGPWWVHAADLNGDGLADLAAAHIGNDEILVFLNDGSGSFGPPTSYPVDDGPEFVNSADLNEDGVPDLVATNTTGVASVFLGTGGGAFTAAPPVILPFEEGHNVHFADFDRDGHVDFLVSHSLQSIAGPPFPPCEDRRPGVSVAYGDGTGHFPVVREFGTGMGYHSAVGDFNNDGFPDIATADLCGPNLATGFAGGEVRVMLNDGAGGFGPPTIFHVGQAHNDLVAHDLDCDGNVDLFVALEDPDDPSIRVLLGDGTGNFTEDPDNPHPSGGEPSAVRVAFLDEDSSPDLVASNIEPTFGEPSTVSVFLNRTPDVDPPVVTCTTEVACLWPPNHKFVDVGLVVSSRDNCQGLLEDGAIAEVTSDEATNSELGAGGKGNPLDPTPHAPDAMVVDGRLLLRAERSGLGDGRVYRITVTSTDASGNIGLGTCEVRVPHDQDPKTPGQVPGNDPGGPCPAVDSGQDYDAFGVN